MGSGSLMRDQTLAPASEARRLSHWTTREVPIQIFLHPSRTRVRAQYQVHVFYVRMMSFSEYKLGIFWYHTLCNMYANVLLSI